MTKDTISTAAYISGKYKAWKRLQEVLKHIMTNYAVLHLKKREALSEEKKNHVGIS